MLLLSLLILAQASSRVDQRVPDNFFKLSIEYNNNNLSKTLDIEKIIFNVQKPNLVYVFLNARGLQKRGPRFVSFFFTNSQNLLPPKFAALGYSPLSPYVNPALLMATF